MMKKKSKKLLLWLFVLTFVLTGIAGCGTKQKDDQEAASTETAGAISGVDDIVGKKIGVQLGTTGDIYVSDYENDGSGTTVERYNKGADAVQALKQGKIDCVVIDEQPATFKCFALNHLPCAASNWAVVTSVFMNSPVDKLWISCVTI